MHPGLIGGIIGGLIGLAGGIFGTWCSIKKSRNTRTRRFVIKAATIVWIAVLIFAVLLLTIPKPYNHLLWIPYAILLPLGIIKMNKMQKRIEEAEDGETEKNLAEAGQS